MRNMLVVWNIAISLAILLLLLRPAIHVGARSLPQGLLTPSGQGSATAQLNNAVAACSGRPHCFILVPPGFPKGAPSGALPSNVTMIDLRQEAVRILRGASAMTNGAPESFAGSPNHSGLVVSTAARQADTNIQDQSIAGLIDNYSPHLNAVGIWGGARSMAPGARTWGGFFNVSNQNVGKGSDAQLVGLEVDTLNYAKPGAYPNDAKDGIQVVGLGHSLNTNAIEVLSNGAGDWTNGIVFDANSVGKDGTLIGEAGKGPYKLGLDFGNATFTDAAILVGQGQRIRLNAAHGAAVIYTRGDALVIQAPAGGIEFDNAQGKPVSHIP